MPLASHGGLHSGGRGLSGSSAPPGRPLGQRRAPGGPAAGRARAVHRQPGLLGPDSPARRGHNRKLAMPRVAASRRSERQPALRTSRSPPNTPPRLRRPRALDEHREAAGVQLESPGGGRKRHDGFGYLRER